MSIVATMVGYSDAMYARPQRCPSCQNDCKGGCEQCLKAIHFPEGAPRDYNCSNIAHFYVCKYIYKYSSEIDHLFDSLNLLNSSKSADIISIGCGPCTDLAGIVTYVERKSVQKLVNYVGFDMTSVWDDIHVNLKAAAQDSTHIDNFKIVNADIFKVLDKIDLDKLSWRPNVLILQYVLSDMANKKASIKSFLDGIVAKIVPYMPINSCVIVNDINLNTARDHFAYLGNAISSKYKTDIFTGHFKSNIGKGYNYGTRQPSNSITSNIPGDIRLKYNPWDFCSSSHIVIQKRSV